MTRERGNRSGDWYYSGKIEVVSTAATINGETTVEVAARVSAR